LLLDLSGKTREIGRGAQRVSEIAVDVVNAQGGVFGRIVELVVLDTRGDPVLGKVGVSDLISEDRVSAVVGPLDWATAMMTKPFFEEKQIPALMLTYEDSVIRGGKFGMYEWIFRLPLRRTTALERIAAYSRERGWTRVGLVVASDGLGREARKWFEKKSASYGFENLAVESFVPAEDVADKMQRLLSQDPQVIVSWSPLPHAATVARILRGLGTDLPLFQCHEIPLREYVEAAGPAARKTLFVSNKMLVWEDLQEQDPQKALIQDFLHQYRDVYRYAHRQPASPFMGYVWDSIMILTRAMRAAGTEGEWLRDSIEGIRRHIGVGGIYGFTHENHNGLDPESLVVMEVDQVYGDGSRWVESWRLAD
jgi:branched-chain amino acid transport system substrate-binding protein